MTHLQKFMQKDKFRIDAKIMTFYKSFKKFICADDLPDFKIQYTDSRNDASVTYAAQVSPYNTPIILNYNIAYMNEKSNKFKTIMVHEFTHLFDYFILKKEIGEDFLKRNLFLYTEYHAVEIEILFCYNIVSNIMEKADIFKTDFSKAIDLPKEKNIAYSNMLHDFVNNPSITKYHLLKTTYMYAVGASSILSQLTGREFPTLHFEEPYKKQMEEVVKLLSTVKYNEVPSQTLLQKIGDIDAEMGYRSN